MTGCDAPELARQAADSSDTLLVLGTTPSSAVVPSIATYRYRTSTSDMSMHTLLRMRSISGASNTPSRLREASTNTVTPGSMPRGLRRRASSLQSGKESFYTAFGSVWSLEALHGLGQTVSTDELGSNPWVDAESEVGSVAPSTVLYESTLVLQHPINVAKPPSRAQNIFRTLRLPGPSPVALEQLFPTLRQAATMQHLDWTDSAFSMLSLVNGTQAFLCKLVSPAATVLRQRTDALASLYSTDWAEILSSVVLAVLSPPALLQGRVIEHDAVDDEHRVVFLPVEDAGDIESGAADSVKHMALAETLHVARIRYRPSVPTFEQRLPADTAVQLLRAMGA